MNDTQEPTDDIAVALQLEIRVYANYRGDIVILQPDWPNDDHTVVVNRANLHALIAAMRRVYDAGEG